MHRYAYGAITLATCLLASLSHTAGQDRGPLWGVAKQACSGKTFARSGTSDAFSLEGAVRFYQKEQGRFLMVTESQCVGLGGQEQPVLVMAHLVMPGRVNAYLTTLRGEMIGAVCVCTRGDDTDYLPLDTSERTLRADFEAEKRYWIAMYP